MSRYSLDTNICIGLLRGDGEMIAALAGHHPDEIVICSIVRAELFYGARNSTRATENMIFRQRFLTAFGTLAFDDAAAEHYGIIRAELRRLGTPIGGNDMLIAAIARAHDCVLVTRNEREFERVPGLMVERW